MKPYLFTYSQQCPAWYAQGILNQTNAITTWVQPFPNAAIVISNLEARDLGAIFRERLGETWFVISELSPLRVDGLLPRNVWEFINSPPTASLPAPGSYAAAPRIAGQPVS